MPTYRDAFMDANGPGPWPCYFCGEPVGFIGHSVYVGVPNGLVHHLDGDPGNDALDNLAAARLDCHTRHR